jgi:hypothetical protein
MTLSCAGGACEQNLLHPKVRHVPGNFLVVNPVSHVPRTIGVRLENVPVCTVKLVAHTLTFQQARERVHLRRIGGVYDDVRRSTLRAYFTHRLGQNTLGPCTHAAVVFPPLNIAPDGCRKVFRADYFGLVQMACAD